MSGRNENNAANTPRLAPLSAAIRKTLRRKPLMLHALEQRYLFDAAAASTLGDALSEQVALEQADQAVAVLAAPQNQDAVVDTDADIALPLAVDATENNDLIFLDRRASNLDALLAGVAPSSDLHLLDTNRDGLEQIQDVLADRPNVSRLQILAPSTAGAIQLGTATLDATSIRADQAEPLAQIGQQLAVDAEVQIFGADLMSSEEGVATRVALEKATGVAVLSAERLVAEEVIEEPSIGGVPVREVITESRERAKSEVTTPVMEEVAAAPVLEREATPVLERVIARYAVT